MDCSTSGSSVLLSPRVFPNSCHLSQWCHLIISFDPLLPPSNFCPQFLLASGSFEVNQPFPSGCQCTASSASASVLPMNIQDWFPSGLTGWISLQTKGLSRVFSNHSLKASILWSLDFFMVQLSHTYMTTGNTIALTIGTFVRRVMSLLFNTLSRFVIAFLSGSNYLRIAWLQWLSAVILEPKKIKSVTASTFPPSICCELMEPDSMILVLWFLFCLFVCFFKLLRFKPAFSLFYPHQEAL